MDSVAFRGLPPTRHMEDTTMVAVFKNESIEIERAVHAALEGRGELEGSRVDVDMAGGTVTLSGTVDCLARKLVAESTAAGVPGVRAVVNELEIPNDGFLGWRDIDLEDGARHILRTNYLLARRSLDVMAHDGVLRVTGKTANIAERDEAERVLVSIPFLRGIRNDILVVPAGHGRWA